MNQLSSPRPRDRAALRRRQDPAHALGVAPPGRKV